MGEIDDRETGRLRLERLYRTERGSLLRRIARAGVVLSDAEDILQDAFLGALNRVDAISPVHNLSAWIGTAVKNRIIDRWRRSRTRREAGLVEITEQLFEEIVSEAGLDPSDELVRDELADAVVEAIDALPKAQREVIVEQVFDGVTFRELSERSGVPIETLAARKRAAIRTLARALRGWVLES